MLSILDWFKAGKGPNPAQAALDAELDNYNAKATA